MEEKPKRNRPADTLIKEYTERVKGKVTSARHELHRRFEHLDYNQQKKILIANLKSTMSDRKWAYPRLLDYWDDSFMAPVLQAWDEYKEPRCSWAIVRHFPKEYIVAHFDELASIGRNYYFMCLRFSGDSDFTVDKERLAPMDLLSVAYRTGLVLTDDEALGCFLRIVAGLCRWDYNFMDYILETIETADEFDPFRITELSRIKFYVGKLNLKEAERIIDQWSAGICRDFENGKSLLPHEKGESSRKMAYRQCTLLATIMNDSLPPELRIKEEPVNNADPAPDVPLDDVVSNPALDDLIKTFDLKIEDSPF